MACSNLYSYIFKFKFQMRAFISNSWSCHIICEECPSAWIPVLTWALRDSFDKSTRVYFARMTTFFPVCIWGLVPWNNALYTLYVLQCDILSTAFLVTWALWQSFGRLTQVHIGGNYLFLPGFEAPLAVIVQFILSFWSYRFQHDTFPWSQLIVGINSTERSKSGDS